MKQIVTALLLASMTGLTAQSALAHSVQTDYLLTPESELSLDVTYSTGDPVSSTPIKIYAPDNPTEPWMEGTTDENGKFSFLPDSGQEGEWTVEIGEFDHGDILSVPVNKNGVELDAISQDIPQTITVGQRWQLGTQPAEATGLSTTVTPTVASSTSSIRAISLDLLLFLGIGGLTGLAFWGRRHLRG